jgi:DNA-binding NtrC family response regulator
MVAKEMAGKLHLCAGSILGTIFMQLPSVLIIEDDDSTRSILILVLSLQFDCMGVGSRDAALELLRAGYRPACVLMDYCMPGLSLEDFLEQTRQFNLEVILISALAQAEPVARALGLQYFLRKPVTPDEILDSVKQAISSAKHVASHREITTPTNPLQRADLAKRVLVIDDADDIRDLLERALKLQSCEVKTVSSRNEALAVMLDGWTPDLILLDYYMPGLSIEAFLKRLIEERTAELPRIVLMTNGCEADKKAGELGIPEVLKKPFDPMDVLTAIAPCAA